MPDDKRLMGDYLPIVANSAEARAEIDQPVVWMQQTDGHHTLTLGLLDQVLVTGIEGSTWGIDLAILKSNL